MQNESYSAPFIWLNNKPTHENTDDKRLELLLKLQALAKMLQFRQDEPIESMTLQNYGILMEELISALLNTY